jgi:hypothetical protein
VQHSRRIAAITPLDRFSVQGPGPAASSERTAWYRFEMEARALRDLEGDMDPFPEGIYGVDPAKAALKTACTSS